MASKAAATTAFLLSLNILLFTLASSAYVPCPPPPAPKTPKCPCPPKNALKNPPAKTAQATCPRDALKFGVCANLLDGLVNIVVGTPPNTPCCSLIQGLADLEAAVCLCTAIQANVMGINLNVPISLNLLLNYCGKNIPQGFQCP